MEPLRNTDKNTPSEVFPTANDIDDAIEQARGRIDLNRINGDETSHFLGGHRDGMRHFMGGANV